MINLEKGGRINLSKEHPSLTRVRIGLGWEANSFDGAPFDLDASIFGCKLDIAGNPRLISDDHFVFYNHLQSPDGAVTHSGDNKTGDAEGDDETIIVDLAKLHPDAVEQSIVVTIHDAIARRQSFGQVRGSYIKLYNDETGQVVAQYSLEEDFSDQTALQFGSLYKKDGEWRFKAVGSGYKRGLAEFVKAYGGNC